jgi:hypothetical protein
MHSRLESKLAAAERAFQVRQEDKVFVSHLDSARSSLSNSEIDPASIRRAADALSEAKKISPGDPRSELSENEMEKLVIDATERHVALEEFEEAIALLDAMESVGLASGELLEYRVLVLEMQSEAQSVKPQALPAF